jgi:hypothetical protein
MKTTYRIVAYLICLGVVLQAASIAFGFFGIGRWVVAGNTLDRHTFLDNSSQLGGYAGLAFHYVVGQAIMPLLGLILLICSFFTRSRSALIWAVAVMVGIIVQILLGLAAFHGVAAGAAHGFLAVAIFAIAGIAGQRITRNNKQLPESQPSERQDHDDTMPARTNT